MQVTMRHIIYIELIFLLLTTTVASCTHHAHKRLALADTLMWTNPDSSLAILSHINNDSLTSDEDRAYHALLLTQAQFRCNGNCSSDSLINFALDYYSDNQLQPYKYSSKELDRENGLDWYDFSARMYDPMLPQFNGADALSEKKPWNSPYAYCGGNPILRVDPTGFDEWDINAITGTVLLM